MGLGSTTKKIQTIADKAEQVYAQIDEVRTQLDDLRTKVDTTHDTVTELEIRHEQNRALLEAIADQQGIDVEEVITEASIEDIEASAADDPKGAPDEVAEGGNETPGDPDEPAETADGAGTEAS